MSWRQPSVYLGALAVLMLSLVSAGAAPDDPPATPQSVAQAEVKPAAQEAARPVAADELTAGGGSLFESVSGNRRRFYQYVTPPDGPYLSRVDWRHWDPRGQLGLDLQLRDITAPERAGDLWLTWADAVTAASRYRRSSYYFDFLPTSGPSERQDFDSRVNSTASPNTGWGWRLTHREVDLEGTPAAGLVDWRDQYLGAVVDFYPRGYSLSLGVNHEDFDFRHDDALSGGMDSYDFAIASRGYHDTAVAGRFSEHITSLDSRHDGVRSWEAALTLSHALNDRINLYGELRRHAIDHTITQNAYARANLMARAEVNYQVHPSTRLTGYWQTGTVDYVDGRHLNVIEVGSNTLGLDVKSRLGREFSFRGRFRQRDVDHRPLPYTIGGSLANTLIYSTTTHLDVSGSYAPLKMPLGLMGQWQQDSWNNNVQGLRNSVNTALATAWWQGPIPRLSLTASYLEQNFRLPLLDVVTLKPYASRAASIVWGANYQAGRRTAVYATVVDAVASGASGTDTESLSLGMNYEASAQDRVLLDLTFGSFGDRGDRALNYDADLYHVEWQREF